MTQPRTNSDGSEQDDWDHHWEAYGDAALKNPANSYRNKMILQLLGAPRPGSVLLDIGSGQGAFALTYKSDHPDVAVWGVEHSAIGVERSRKSAADLGIDAHFLQRDLLSAVEPDPDQPPATLALCSEVLEHVDDPATLIRNSLSLLAPGAKLVVTVPGGPRSAFDKHIGHFRHFTAPLLCDVLTDGGLDVDRVLRTGFPFFNVYKLAVISQGERLVEQIENGPADGRSSRAQALAGRVFDRAFRLNRDDSRFGWQLAAVAHVPARGV